MVWNHISPIDGRYYTKTQALAPYFSEKALMKYRVMVEIHYLILLSQQKPAIMRQLSPPEKSLLLQLTEISDQDAHLIKKIETEGIDSIPATNHDVKAIEYFLKLKLKETSLADLTEMIHFALTSEDINNLAYALMLRDGINKELFNHWDQVYTQLYQLAVQYKNSPMLARTHGQPASPTTFGKEILIFVNRFKEEILNLVQIKIQAKLNGATGNYNAHMIAYPDIDWPGFSKKLIASLNETIKNPLNRCYLKEKSLLLCLNPITPQIESHDSYIRIFDAIRRVNTILIDFCQDIWRYISDAWIIQKTVKGEIGSSTMPHKVNPIDFENSEGNLGLANALLQFFSQKLPISRLQRDLSDSTVLRNCGVALAHSLIAYQSLKKGLSKIILDEKKLLSRLKAAPEVIAEAYQTLLRSAGIKNPYELLKEITRGKEIKLADFHQFVHQLDLDSQIKEKMLSITPENYVGIAAQIVENFKPEL